MLRDFQRNSNEILKNIYQGFRLKILWGAEQEFYAKDSSVLNIAGVKEERGKNQFEIVSPVFDDATDLNNFLLAKRNEILDCTKDEADFSAKPFLNDYGSALQISFSIIDDEENLLLDLDEIDNNEIGQKIIFQLLKDMGEVVKEVCNENDDLRYCPNYMSPTHICWGGTENRTTAIRFIHKKPRRIEYRVAPSSANFYQVIYYIADGIYKGLNNKNFDAIPRIWGNAYDAQYKLTSLK